jgi:hypothetical protein
MRHKALIDDLSKYGLPAVGYRFHLQAGYENGRLELILRCIAF